jgi:hypothetical protein
MAKVKHNKFTMGLSGKFGNLVFRQMKDGRTILATRPDYTNHKWTTDQRHTTVAFKRQPPTRGWHQKQTHSMQN